MPSIRITCSHPPLASEAQLYATQLGVSVNAPLDDARYQLGFDEQGVSLTPTDKKLHGPVKVDFVGGKTAHRRLFGGGKNQLLAKAVGIKNGAYPRILDATAGLGQDAFVLAGLGCEVTLLERSPIVFALLADGFQRAKTAALDDAPLERILKRMQFRQADSIAYLNALSGQACEVVYLDPMFPERQKAAAVNKSMQAFHLLLGGDLDGAALLALALEKTIYRVVVKRPRLAPRLEGCTPTYSLTGKSVRFDIYVNRSLQKEL